MSIFDRFKTLLNARLNVEERFQLLREAASGTMSSFYMARDRATGQIVGLKILDPEKTRLFEARFKGLSKPTEGQIAMQLDHPHIVRTLEHGVTRSGRYYLVMEYLEGPGLNLLIQQHNPLLDGKRLTLIQQMAEALRAVHQAGFIHRDVCPRNFICSRDASSLKLIDFGLTVPATRPFMQPGNRTGTPNYMAPEVIRRRSTDQRLDIFSLGVTCFQLCTCQLPWPSSDVSGKVAILHDTQEPADILTLEPGLNRRLAELIKSCLAPNPIDRPQTVDEFLRTLSGIESERE